MMQKVETLARIPLFRSLPAGAIERLNRRCIWRRSSAHEWILDYKDDSTDVYFVASGHVRVLIQATSGNQSILRDIRDGEFFGELAAIDSRPRSAAIVAITDSILAKMSPSVFRDVVHEHPDVCDHLLLLLASQIRTLANRVNEFGKLDVRTRIYAELLRLSRAVRNADKETVISPPPTHAELAARVSCRREAVTRELNHLKRIGLLQSRRGALVLLDPARLASLIEAVDD
jgi:CRP/FNR family transcriptional regulator, cyclic AMP receptor protein